MRRLARPLAAAPEPSRWTADAEPDAPVDRVQLMVDVEQTLDQRYGLAGRVRFAGDASSSSSSTVVSGRSS